MGRRAGAQERAAVDALRRAEQYRGVASPGSANDAPRYRVGIDENGLGPRLGPLVVTAVHAVTTGPGHALVGKRPRGALARRLGDSKALVSFQDTALGEAWARALGRRLALGEHASPDALIDRMALDGRDTLQARCPSGTRDQCWSTMDEVFIADDDLVGKVMADLHKLCEKGVRVVGVQVATVCAERLNDAVSRGLSRFAVDLHTMERLALAAREAAGEEIEVTCGKVGGYDRYSDAFGPLSGRLHTPVVEGRARSEYKMLGLGTLSFVRDADAKHLLVCMASLIGKWVREVMMARVTRFYRAEDPSLPVASGYHDPVTARFIASSRLARKARNVSDTCFERRRLPDDPGQA